MSDFIFNGDSINGSNAPIREAWLKQREDT